MHCAQTVNRSCGGCALPIEQQPQSLNRHKCSARIEQVFRCLMSCHKNSSDDADHAHASFVHALLAFDSAILNAIALDRVSRRGTKSLNSNPEVLAAVLALSSTEPKHDEIPAAVMPLPAKWAFPRMPLDACARAPGA